MRLLIRVLKQILKKKMQKQRNFIRFQSVRITKNTKKVDKTSMECLQVQILKT